MKMSTQNFLDIYFKNRMIKVSTASTVIKVISRYEREKEERKNFPVQVNNVQTAIRNYLKIVKSLRYKKAVRTIEK